MDREPDVTWALPVMQMPPYRVEMEDPLVFMVPPWRRKMCIRDRFWLCDQLRAAGRADLPPIRLNTNGHGSLINHRDITPELKGRLDAVSVSLNGSNREEYLRLTRPGAGEKGWQAMLDFVRHAVQYVPKVMVSIVDYDKSPQEMEACRRLAEELGATFRVRPFAG